MSAAAVDMTQLSAWLGRQSTLEDPLPSFPAAALAATLDSDETFGRGDRLPPLWHWVYFLDRHKTRDLAENGHVRHGGFLPPMPWPQRMFAGARLRFHRPLRIDEPARRTSTIAEINSKRGRSGALIFVRLRNEFHAGGELALEEEQDIVYRETPAAIATAPPRPIDAQPLWIEERSADEILLFRYSALIFNAHRIHWDRAYARSTGGYPGLIVHGQLIATWLAELVRSHGERPVAAFEFRSVRPLYDAMRCVLCAIPDGEHVRLWAQDEQGVALMEAKATLA
ncbi:MAG: MaoC family dehydratase N-terminal domain-containing protein [Burkholderiales bacterium]|nr:MaoC family dehydratase N-terminal domain-containing protein [Burkholderiales bacterium]